MRILVIGGTRGVGRFVISEGLARGHQVTAMSRKPDKLEVQHPQLTKVKGDFHDQASVAAAVTGHDAVIITAGPPTLKGFKEDPTFFSRGTGFVIGAMKAKGIKRLAILSAFGTGETRQLAPFLLRKLLFDLLLKLPMADHEREEALVRKSGLEWVIARPTGLTNKPGNKTYKATSDLVRVPNSIARADVADFLVTAVEGSQWVGKAVQLGG